MSAPAPAHGGKSETTVRVFWPPAEAAQADYEALRAAVLAGTPLADAKPLASPGRAWSGCWTARCPSRRCWSACLGAGRPPWTPQADPRLDALAAGYALLLDVAGAALQCTGRQPHEGGGA